MTQDVAAQRCDINRARWAQLECGYRRPSRHEEWRIRSFLDLKDYMLEPQKFVQSLILEGKSLTGAPGYHLPEQDRPSFVRYFAARRRHPKLVSGLKASVLTRQDALLCAAFCNKLRIDSSLEAVHLLYLLARGAKPCLVYPSAIGFLTHKLVDPVSREYIGNRRHLCLYLEGDFYFFQISFSVPELYTVDVLVWSGHQWAILELDGAGHDGRSDSQRDAALAMPIRRLTEESVLRHAQGALGFAA